LLALLVLLVLRRCGLRCRRADGLRVCMGGRRAFALAGFYRDSQESKALPGRDQDAMAVS